jgi:hypothetical protein
MDPISISIELELGALLLALVGGFATWANNRHQKERRRQRELHHREVTQLQREQHREHLAVLRATSKVATEALDVCADDEPAPAPRPGARRSRSHA